MIRGRVAGHEAEVDVILRPPDRPDIAITFVVDTGFEGALSLPPAVVDALRLPYFTRLDANLADNFYCRNECSRCCYRLGWSGVRRGGSSHGASPFIGNRTPFQEASEYRFRRQRSRNYRGYSVVSALPVEPARVSGGDVRRGLLALEVIKVLGKRNAPSCAVKGTTSTVQFLIGEQLPRVQTQRLPFFHLPRQFLGRHIARLTCQDDPGSRLNHAKQSAGGETMTAAHLVREPDLPALSNNQPRHMT